MNSLNLANTARLVPGVHLPCYVFPSGKDLARRVSQVLAAVIRERNALGRKAVLGLPTGSSPVGVYRELIRMHREEELDFSNVVTFNLDEYFGLHPDALQSYHRWMDQHLFAYINIPPENINIPDGTRLIADVPAYCREYEARIRQFGGIDVMLLGIGTNGHIGFNEPFSPRDSRTRLCTLDQITRKVAAGDFFSDESVPSHSISMGLATILEARKILLVAMGEHKAKIVREAFEGPATVRVPASLLQEHDDACVLLDSAAAKDLTACSTPWLIGDVPWNDPLIKRAVLWLCDKSGKALLKLADDDFESHNLHSLLRNHGPAEQLAHRVFRWMMETIEYHPAGREPRRVICFSPHPDDDVISMGGTLIRLVQDGHQVHIAYMTTGNIAVFDHDASRIADFVTEYNRMFGIDDQRAAALEEKVNSALTRKRPGELDVEEVQKIKALIRWSEAKAGAEEVGCREEHLHFLDLPFYRTGAVAKRPIGDDDVRIIRELIDRVQPHQIYVAGDLSDPHGTHRLCADAIFRTVLEMEQANLPRPEVLLYRGAWQEYELHEIEICVPLSPSDLQSKRQAIFMHESQKDEALFPGSDPREFWQRAEDRNKGTADKYNRIGLPEYYAMEAFLRWSGVPI